MWISTTNLSGCNSIIILCAIYLSFKGKVIILYFVRKATKHQTFGYISCLYFLGHDIFSVETELPSTTMSYQFKRFNFPRKVKLYCNVVAYSLAGVHRTVSSDGFELDSDYPITGVVYDGHGRFLLIFMGHSF